MNRNLREVVRGLSGDADAWFAIGQAAAEAGETDQARYALLHSVQLAPADLQRAIDAGQLLAQAACAGEAERLFRQVLHEVPDLAPLRIELARLLLEQGRNQDACAEIDRALATPSPDGQADTSGDDVAILQLAAEANLRVGNRLRARELLGQVLSKDPDHTDANRKLAAVHAQLGDRIHCIQCWRRAVGKDPADHEAATALGIALSEDGQHVEAIALLRRLTRQRELDAAAHANLGMALLSAGNLDDALEALLRARALDPTSASAHCGLGLAHQRLARWGPAAEAFAATERLAPGNPAGPFNLALVLQALHDLDGARAALARAAALAPDDPEIKQALVRMTPPDSTPVLRTAPGASSPYIDAAIAGDLKSFQLFDVLELLRMQNKTGSLVLSSRQGAGIVRLCQGAITSASAPGVSHLGQVIVAAGLLTTDTLQAVLAQQRASPVEAEVLGAVLLRGSLITEAQLGQVLFQQILEALGQISAWGDGTFSFHRDQQGTAPPVSFSVPQVVLEVVRRRDEQLERENRAQAYLERSGTT
jgi:tetratricopeptide (TPR) repeat protein